MRNLLIGKTQSFLVKVLKPPLSIISVHKWLYTERNYYRGVGGREGGSGENDGDGDYAVVVAASVNFAFFDQNQKNPPFTSLSSFIQFCILPHANASNPQFK